MSGEPAFNTSALPGVAQLIATPASVESPMPAGGDTALPSQRMCVRIGRLYLLIPADHGREVISPPAISRIPHTVPWLRGLANVRGNLVPVVDLASALDATEQRVTQQTYLLILGQGDSAIGILISGLPRLVTLEEATPSELPSVPPLLQGVAVTTYENNNQIWIDVDLKALFDVIAGRVAL